MQNRKKNVFENVYFFYIVFGAMFCDLERFWLHFGRPWGVQKFEKNGETSIWDMLGMPLGRTQPPRIGFLAIFDRFLSIWG